jgi:hypothetical protein
VQPNYHLLAKLLKPFKVNLKPDQPVVALDIEYGFKTYIWIPDMTCSELERWWLRQKNVGKFYPLPAVDGVFLQDVSKCKETGDGYWDYLSYDTLVWTTYNRVKNANLGYTCHLFCDDDSYLITPKNRFIHHMGYWPARLQTERDVKEQLNVEDIKAFLNETDLSSAKT